MKKTFLFAGRAAALSTLVVALTASALQTVVPVKDTAGTAYTGSGAAWTGTAGLGTVVTVIGRYTTDNPTANESGLGLKVVYDEAKFTGVTVTPLITNCMIAQPQIQAGGAATKAVLGWIDTAVRNPAGAVGWPYLADPAASSGPPVTAPCLSPNTAPVNGTGANGPGAVNLFQFQGTLATAVGIGNTATVQFVSDGNFSYATTTTPGMGDQTLTITAAAAPTIALSSAVSRKSHGPSGGPFVDFDLPLPNFNGSIGGTIDVEPRLIGTQGHKIVFKFSSAVTSVGTPSIASGVALASVSGASATAAVSGSDVVVTLSGVPDAQRIQVTLPGVNGVLSATANVAFLAGDVNGSLITSGTDVNAVKSGAAAAVNTTSASNFKLDVNADGAVSGTDVNAVKSRAASSPGTPL